MELIKVTILMTRIVIIKKKSFLFILNSYTIYTISTLSLKLPTSNESTEAINEQIDITSQQVSIQSNTKTKNKTLKKLQQATVIKEVKNIFSLFKFGEQRS
ncbi:hypothetical protein ACTFIZ_012459 [Dictyostelium cf. discoideum]